MSLMAASSANKHLHIGLQHGVVGGFDIPSPKKKLPEPASFSSEVALKAKVDWSIEVTGLVAHPTRFTIQQLLQDFPSREFPATLATRAGEQQTAAISTSVWRGVPLWKVLKRCGVFSRAKGALHVCFEGSDKDSIMREIALDPSRDIIIAYMKNGEPLSPHQGFPVRIIIPGFIGPCIGKSFNRIIVATQHSDVHSELANTQDWWYKPEYTINELNVNSVITTPSHDEILPINSLTIEMPYVLRGYAYAGGGRKVTRVEVTLDGGETWQVCMLDCQEKPNKYGKYWCRCLWSLEVEVSDLLGATEIAVRAWDEALNTQPENLNSNVMGMMNNCWFRVKTNVGQSHKGDHEIGIVFDHPVQLGNHSGGWIPKQKHLQKSSNSNPTHDSVRSAAKFGKLGLRHPQQLAGVLGD